MRTKNPSPSGNGTAVAEPPQTPAPKHPNSGPQTGLRRIAFAKPPAKSDDTKTKYPVFADEAVGKQVTDIAERVKNRADDIEALEGAQKTDKAELKMLVSPFYFRTNHLKVEPPSSISIPSPAGEVLVTFPNRYYKQSTETALAPIIGEARVAELFRQSFSLTIPGEGLPAGQEQEIVDEIQAVLQRHGVLACLEVKEEIKPTPEFHVARHRLFTPEVNLAIDQAFPIVAMVKTKGRGN